MAQDDEIDIGDVSQEEEGGMESNKASSEDIKKDQRASSGRKRDRRA